MNEDTLGVAGDRRVLLVPVILALVLLTCVALAGVGRHWTGSRTALAVLTGPITLLNGTFARGLDGWTAVGKGSVRWVPEYGGSLALSSASPAAPVGAVAAPGAVVVGSLANGVVYRLSVAVRLVKPGVRNVRLAILDCIGGAAAGLASPDLTARLRADGWTTVSMQARLRRAACTTGSVPGVQITAVGSGDLLRIDDVSLTRV